VMMALVRSSNGEIVRLGGGARMDGGERLPRALSMVWKLRGKFFRC